MHKYLMVLLAGWCVGAFAQTKSQPDDMAVGKYKILRDKYTDDFEVLADKAPRVVELKKEIELLKRPLKLGDRITIRTKDFRGRSVSKTGKFSKITSTKVTISGIHDYKKADVDAVDWLWMEGASNPANLKKEIEDRRASIEKQKKVFINSRVDQKLIDDGYNKAFLNDVVELGNNFIMKKALGDGTLSVRALRYSSAEHMKDFVEIEIYYRGNEAIAGVLMVEYPAGSGKEIALCSVGGISASGKIDGKKFRKIKFFLNRADLAKKIGARWERSLRKSRLVMMKRLHGFWELHSPRPRGENKSTNVPCADCWGKGKVAPVGAIDISKYSKEKLDKAKAKPAIRTKGDEIVAKYKNAEKKELLDCPTCNGSGEGSKRSRMRGVRLTYVLNTESIRAYSAEEYKKFEKLYNSVETFGDVDAIKKQFSKKYTDERIADVTKDAHEEIDALVAEFSKKYKKRAFSLLEDRFRGGWMTRKELLVNKRANDPGVGNSLFGEKEREGYAPQKLYDLKVRRFSDWKLLKNFQKIGGLNDNSGFELNPVFYRVVEIGGSDIDQLPEVNKAGGGDTDGRIVHDEQMNSETLRQMPPAPGRRGRDGRRVSGDKDSAKRKRPESDRQNQNEDGEPGEREASNGGAAAVKVEEVDLIPDDIKERVYVIQYAAKFRSLGKAIKLKTDFQVMCEAEIDPTQDVNFELAQKDKLIKATHNFSIVPSWTGWLIGSRKITFEQMVSSFDYKTITFKVFVK